VLVPLVLRPEVGLVAVDDESNGCSTLYLTTNFSRWRNVSPPAPHAANRACLYGWGSASFVSKTAGWVLGRNGGGINTVLLHTDDGGRSWVEQPGGTVGSNGGEEVIGFANHQDGWRQQFAIGSNQPYTLEITHDGGTNWDQAPPPESAGGCPFATDVFADAQDGFAGTFLPPTSTSGPNPWLWHTTNGGESWDELTVSAPAGFSAAAPVYGLPTFFGAASGVMPVIWTTGAKAAVVFYGTTDLGATWSVRGLEPIAAGSVSTSPSPCYLLPASNTGLPAVAVASPTTWWVATTRPSSVAITTNAGATWVHRTTTSMPNFQVAEVGSVQPPVLWAANRSLAWLDYFPAPGNPVVYETTDGGVMWHPLQIHRDSARSSTRPGE